MAVMEVSLPSGYSVDRDSLPSLQGSQMVKRVETKEGDSIVMMYFDEVIHSNFKLNPTKLIRKFSRWPKLKNTVPRYQRTGRTKLPFKNQCQLQSTIIMTRVEELEASTSQSRAHFVTCATQMTAIGLVIRVDDELRAGIKEASLKILQVILGLKWFLLRSCSA